MTVRELMKLLETFPPEAKVVVRGYEQGYDDIKDVRPVRVGDWGFTSWRGRYEKYYEGFDTDADKSALYQGTDDERVPGAIEAVYIEEVS